MDPWTFLFTDIEDSTALQERVKEAYRPARSRHYEILRTIIAAHGGNVFRDTGDGLYAAFGGNGAVAALECAVACQQALRAENWAPPIVELRVRMGLHWGEAERLPDDFDGRTMHLATRVLNAGHGGQIVCSSDFWTQIDDARKDELEDHGLYRLKGFKVPVRLFQARHAGMRQREIAHGR